MYGQWMVIVGAVISVFAVIGVGAAVRWAGWLSRETDQSLLALIMRVLFPCLIFSVISDNPALREAENLWLPPLVGVVTVAIGFAAAAVVGRLGHGLSGLADASARRTFVLSVGFLNYTFVPIPLVRYLFDEETLGVLFVHNVGAGMAVYTIGVALVSGEFGRRWWRAVLNGPSIAIVAALVVNALGLGPRLPLYLTTAVEWLGQAAIPMSLLVIGAITADEFLGVEKPSLPEEHWFEPRSLGATDGVKLTLWACLLRLGLLPAATLFLAALLPLSLELGRVMAIMAAMPAATFSIVLVRHYRGAPRVALLVALSTSIASLITIPLWIPLGMRLLGLGSIQ